MATGLSQSTRPQTRTIDGLSIRFAESAGDHFVALVTSGWAGGYREV
jgi:hypothetical protein